MFGEPWVSGPVSVPNTEAAVDAVATARGRKKYRADGAAIEMYDRGRFFTVTCQALPGLSLDADSRQEQFDRFCQAVCGAEGNDQPHTGLGHAFICQLIAAGKLRTASIRRPGRTRGVSLMWLPSLLELIERHVETTEIPQATAQVKPAPKGTGQ